MAKSQPTSQPGEAASDSLPQVLTYPATAPPSLVAQGAEGRLYKTSYLLPDLPCAFKHRPRKPYRHPTLDQRLTRHRILAEARILAKCRKEGVPVPAVYGLDENAGWLAMEWIDGEPVRAKLNAWLKHKLGEPVDANAALKDLMRRVGDVVGRLHKVGIIHGDLTTSNMMLRPLKKADSDSQQATDVDALLSGDIIVIDFGLASQGLQDEDRAVDLYVLERAFSSTHPRAEGLFDQLLDGYKGAFKHANVVLKKLEEVRMRGRKRSMVG